MTTTIILIGYLLLLVYIALTSATKIKNHNDFYVANKQGSIRSITGSLLATILGGSAVIGAIDAGPSMGWATSWYMLMASIGLLLLLPMVKKVSTLGRFTLPELLESLYGERAKQTSSLVIPVAWLGIISAQIIASARILQSFTAINYETGVIISALVFTLYTLAGGQISILKTDFLQAILIISGVLVIALYANHYDGIKPAESFSTNFPLNNNFKVGDLLILLITYATTFTAGPDIYSRIFSSKNTGIAKRSILITALILIPMALIIGYLSVFGSLNEFHSNQGSTLIEISKNVLPNWIVPLVVLGLLSAVLSSADTTILSSSIIVTDLIQKKGLSSASLKTSRLIILITGIIAMVIALQFTSIIGMLLLALTIYSGAFVVPILLGLSGLKSNPKFVQFAMIVGGSVALFGKLLIYTSYSAYSNVMVVIAFVANALIITLGKQKSRLR